MENATDGVFVKSVLKCIIRNPESVVFSQITSYFNERCLHGLSVQSQEVGENELWVLEKNRQRMELHMWAHILFLLNDFW